MRAIETEDATAALLTRDDREQATGAAIARAAAGRGPEDPRALFLAERSRFALDRLAARYPAVAQVERRGRWPSWAGWALPLAALLLGWAGNEVFDGRRLNVISLPLTGMILWNLAVYALLLFGTVASLARRREVPTGGPLARFYARAARPGRGAQAQPSLARGLARFGQDWLRFAAPLNGARVRRTLHLAAAALAAGVVLGMYASGWEIDYRAGWESTWVRDPGTLHRLLSLVLGPASALTGIALPGPAELPLLDWSAGRPGVPAAPWIHLYAATAFIFIIGPRLALAAVDGARAGRLARKLRVPGQEDFYMRTLLRSIGGEGAGVRIVPYSFALGEERQRTLRRLLADVLGEKSRIAIEPAIAYGGEDDWLGGSGFAALEEDWLILVFNLSATPEAENHGALVAGIRDRLARAGRETAVAAILDESAMRQKLGNDVRLASRAEAWRAVLRPHGVDPVALDLASDQPLELVRALEAGLAQAAPGRAR